MSSSLIMPHSTFYCYFSIFELDQIFKNKFDILAISPNVGKIIRQCTNRYVYLEHPCPQFSRDHLL